MKKNILQYKNLVIQSEYARFRKLSRARICQLVKEKRLNIVHFNGGKVIELTPEELKKYLKFKKNDKITF